MKKIYSILTVAILLPLISWGQLEGRTFKADGRPTTGTIKVHCFYIDSIPSKKHRTDKVYGELKGAPTFVNHELEGVTVSIYKHDSLVNTGTTDTQGYYQWANAPLATYKIVASKPSYIDFTVTKELQVGLLNETECKMKQASTK